MVPGLSLHTQIAVVARRDTCHAELWNPQDCSDHPTSGSLAPSLMNTGLESLFMACQLCFLPHLVSKAEGHRVGSPGRNKHLWFRLSEQFSMQLPAPTAVSSPAETVHIWGHILVSVRESESCGALAHCRNGLLRIIFNVMTLAWDMKCLVRKQAAWACKLAFVDTVHYIVQRYYIMTHLFPFKC